MHAQGILKTDDLITRFFRLCTEMCVDLCYRALLEQSSSAQTSQTMTRQKCFYTLDAFVRLIALLVKHSGDTGNTVTKINLLNKVSCRIHLCLLDSSVFIYSFAMKKRGYILEY